MLENIDLSRTVEKREYKAAKKELDVQLVTLQRQAIERKIPILIVFEGWDAAGKGSMINELILPLDPRGFKVHSIPRPTGEESLRPFLWRFWIRTPASGRLAIFDRGWYWPLFTDRVNREITRHDMARSLHDISAFERQLVDGGTVLIKLFLHISKKEQKRRFRKLRRNPSTAWRVTKEDLKRQKQYDKYLALIEESLAGTDTDYAPWTVVESHDRRFAVLKIYRAMIAAVQRRIDELQEATASRKPKRAAAPPAKLIPAILEKVSLDKTLDRKEYDERLEKAQDRIRELEHEIYSRRIPVVLVYEGWDAAGKGGNLRRLVRNLDPRGYEVVPIAAPNDAEKAQHYLWRFWRQMPKAGHITIFDRSWYGRVMVERVEGFCSEAEWRRAYSEINEMEQHMANFGTVILKFWLHISPEEQLRRFKEREHTAYKRWKITDEDWRNRAKWKQYQDAVEEMLYRTSTPHAPWIIVESNCKLYARVKVIETVIAAIEKRLAE